MSNRRNLLAWLTDEGNENLFVHYILVEKMYGKALRGTDRADLKEIGVKTMGRRFLLLEEIKALLSSNSSLNSTG